MLASHQAAPLAEAPLVAPNPGDVIGLQRALGERGVVCSTPDGLLRFAPHWPNHRAEIPGVLAAIDAALGTS